MSDEAMSPSGPIVDEEAQAMPDSTRRAGGVGLCLSGGGYRAMLFHLGGFIRLNQLGMLRGLSRVSSVSGGSIAAARLGVCWKELTWDAQDRATNLDAKVIEPVVAFAARSVDARSILAGIVTPFRSVSDFVVRQYRHLFDHATLQDLPDEGDGPRFVINATNVQTGKLLRFSRPYMADYTVGMWELPDTSLAEAVAASSAFPPVLSPCRIKPRGTFTSTGVPPRHGPEFRKRLVLTDGGVYDNLGLQTAWSRCDCLLVSDGGGTLDPGVKQPGDWARHGVRISEIIDSQVRALRKRQLMEAFRSGRRSGTYWGIASQVAAYKLADALTFVHDPPDYPGNVPTRLTGLDETVRRDLVRWGYVICDTAVRTWVKRDASKPDPSDVPS